MGDEPTGEAAAEDRPPAGWWPLELLAFRRLAPRRLTEACRRLRRRHSAAVRDYGWQAGEPRPTRIDGDA